MMMKFVSCSDCSNVLTGVTESMQEPSRRLPEVWPMRCSPSNVTVVNILQLVVEADHGKLIDAAFTFANF